MKEMNKVVCPECGTQFESTISAEKKPKCYDCALQDYTHGGAIEEGDINSARIVSGTMTPEEEEYLMEALAAVEEGRSVREYCDDFSSDDERCPGCWHYVNDCRCP